MFFISSSCKAQFYNGSHVTFYVRKECVDIIFKIRRGVYLTVSIFSLSDGRLLLACAWDSFWNRLRSMRNRNDVLKKLMGSCPLAADIFLDTSDPHFAYIDAEQKVGAIIKEMNVPIISNNITDFLHNDVLKNAAKLMEYNLNLLVELEENCPFLQWKKDLERLRG